MTLRFTAAPATVASTLGFFAVFGMLWYTFGVWPTRLWTPENIAESKARAEVVIGAIDRYTTAHGRPPAELSDIVPTFLKVLPLPTAGAKEWVYGTNPAGDQFQLVFTAVDEHAYPSWDYLSETRTWRYNP